jgi:hypothetical protein
MPFVDSNLYIDKYDWTDPAKLSGTYISGSFKDVFLELTPNIWANRGQESGSSVPTIDWNNLAARAMANANPNRPVVDIPVFLYELRELPGMIHHLGQLLKRNRRSFTDPYSVSETYLGWTFGWRPLINDLISMVTFQKAIANRIAYLERLRSKSSIRRSLGSLSSPNTQSATQVIAGGSKASVSGYTTTNTKTEVWYTMRMQLITDLSSVAAVREAAIRTVFGLELSPATLWELVPWSWLVDWFTNFGQLLSLTRGIVEYRQSNLNLMAKTTIEINHVLTSASAGIALSGNTKATRILKQRKASVPHAFPALYMPWLSYGQIGILGALATLRMRGSRR